MVLYQSVQLRRLMCHDRRPKTIQQINLSLLNNLLHYLPLKLNEVVANLRCMELLEQLLQGLLINKFQLFPLEIIQLNYILFIAHLLLNDQCFQNVLRLLNAVSPNQMEQPNHDPHYGICS